MSWEKENPVAFRFHEQWLSMIGWANSYLNLLSDEDLNISIVLGKNHALWILGHLIESEDDLSKFLGRGEMLYPEYEALFGQGSKLQPLDAYPSAATLREQWKVVCQKNDKMLKTILDKEWDDAHALVNGDIEGDFYGTKGRCIHLWIIHQNYHVGQLALLLSLLNKTKY